MPNRVWYCAASPLRPQEDSSIACAMVTAAGTPNRCCAAIAPGATRLMNACWSRVPGVAYCRPAELAVAVGVGDGAGVVAAGVVAAGCVGCTLGAAGAVAAACVGCALGAAGLVGCALGVAD